MVFCAAFDLGDYLLGDAKLACLFGRLGIVALAAARPVTGGVLQFPDFIFVTAETYVFSNASRT